MKQHILIHTEKNNKRILLGRIRIEEASPCLSVIKYSNTRLYINFLF